MPGAAVCRHNSALLSSIDFPLAPPLYAFACAPAANPSSRVGLDAAGRYRLRRHRLLPLVDTASSTFMSATPPLGSVSTTSRTPARPGRARLIRHRRGQDLVRLDELCILPQLDLPLLSYAPDPETLAVID
jgi:hypothetical protein